MRVLLTSVLMLTGGAAMASSITPLESHGGNGSVVVKSCASCPPIKVKEEAAGYKVPVLESGAQKTEIVEIGGEKKLVRTEAWLGGSPVVHVSKVQDWMSGNDAPAADGIDHEAMVGAVQAGVTGQAATQSVSFTGETMRLRLK